ncbi:MAG: hypothetical protein JSV20_00600 [Candidatus Bathyarchaeota archaeon]|nr:MAG: hypothetical protein JSV20_00600 [Candidatus Bathyarchaeota archaeon]
MSEEIKKRTIRVLINSVILFVIRITLDLTVPGALTLLALIPKEGLSIGTALVLILTIITIFLALRIIVDLIRLVDLTSGFIIKYIPGLKGKKKISLTRALKEILLVLILVLVMTIISPILLNIPKFGTWIARALSIIFTIISIILIYDAGKTLYAIFQSTIQHIIDQLSFEKEQNKV